ncbi:hypothetical protein ANTPLA_LOCUS10321 [Anthophora plagiata]
MTIHKKNSGKGKGTTKEVATSSSSSDMTTVETVEVVSSTSVVEEARQVTESESRSSVVEMSSASREVIMDSKGNVIQIIDTPSRTTPQIKSTYKSGRSSQDFIAEEQTQNMKQSKTVTNSPEKMKDLEIHTGDRRGGGTLEQITRSSESRSESRAETMEKSMSSTTVVETSSSMEDYHDHLSKAMISNGTTKSNEQYPRVQTSSKSYESTQASKETYEAVTKDGQTMASSSRIRETGEKVDDNGRVTASQSRSVDNETTVSPSVPAGVKHTDDVRVASSKVIHDSSVSESTLRSGAKADKRDEAATWCNKPVQSAWDGTFISESTPQGKEENIRATHVTSRRDRDTEKARREMAVNDMKQDNAVSSVEITESSVIDQHASSSTIIHDSTSFSSNIESSFSKDSLEHISGDTIDFSGGVITTEVQSSKGSTRYAKPGESTWDGTFVIEKTPQPRKRNVSDATVFHHPGGDNVVESTQRMDFKEKSLDGSYEKMSSNVVHVVQGATDSSKFISEERRDVTEEIYIDGKPVKRTDISKDRMSPVPRDTRPGESTWNGKFTYEKPQDNVKKSSTDKTVVRTSEKRHDSVDVQDITEEQNISNVSQSVSSSYVVEYATISDEKKKTSEKVTSVSETILEEDSSESGSPRRPGSPQKSVKQDTTTRSYKPGQSTWDGSFVYEKPQTPDRRRIPEAHRNIDSVVIRDVTEDNSINEAEISSASYVVEHSSSQQSFTEVKDSSLTSVHETVIVDGQRLRQDGASRPGTPEKTPKGRETRITKPGSSTWDGTFVKERTPETKRPPSRESIDRSVDKSVDKARPERGESPTRRSRKHVSDVTIDIRDTAQKLSTSSEIFSNSVVMEQSTMHESYVDSSNLDYSTSSMETVIIRNGVPTTIEKTVSIEEGSKGPEKQPLEQTDRRPRADDTKLIEKRPKSPEKTDRSARPTKPGASTWDGSFVYEKPSEKPSDKRSPPDTTRQPIDKQTLIQVSPTDGGKLLDSKQPTYLTEKSITLLDTSRETSEYVSSTTLERTLLTDTEVHDSSKVSTTIIQGTDDTKRPGETVPETPRRKQPEDGRKSPEKRSKSPEKSIPIDRTARPSKPGASTWDGSFVYEKPQDQRKKPTDEDRKPSEKGGKELTVKDKMKDERASSPVPKDDVTHVTVVRHDVTDVRDTKDITDIELIQKSSYVIDQSSNFTTVQDVRDVVEERVISEFTTDTRKDVVSNEMPLANLAFAIVERGKREGIVANIVPLEDSSRTELTMPSPVLFIQSISCVKFNYPTYR